MKPERKIISSRGMGKTTALLKLAENDCKKGNGAIFVTPFKNQAMDLSIRFSGSSIIFMTFEEFIERGIYKHPGGPNINIYIDEIDWCLASIIPNEWNYSYTIGD